MCILQKSLLLFLCKKEPINILGFIILTKDKLYSHNCGILLWNSLIPFIRNDENNLTHNIDEKNLEVAVCQKC